MAVDLFLGQLLQGRGHYLLGHPPPPPAGSTIVSVFDKYNEMYLDVDSDRLTIDGLSMITYDETEQKTRTVWIVNVMGLLAD